MWDRSLRNLLPIGLVVACQIPVIALARSAAAQQRATACGGVFAVQHDASVREASPGVALGADSILYVGSDARGESRTFLTFDLRDRIPPGATIYRAVVQLKGDLPRFPVDIRQVAHLWDERSVTWNAPPALDRDYGAQTFDVNGGNYDRSTELLRIDVTKLVTAWTTTQHPVTSLALLARGSGLASFDSTESLDRDAQPPQLLVQCALPVIEQPADDSVKERRQGAAIRRLKDAALEFHDLQIERGAIRFADFRLPLPAAAGDDALSRAEFFLDNNRDLVGLTDPSSELQLVHRSRDGQHLRFRQLHHGIPVYPAELGVHLKGSLVQGLFGRYNPAITLSPIPRLGAADAEALALSSAGERASLSGETQLRYLNLGLLGQPDRSMHLAWEVHVLGAPGSPALFIDANSGRLLFRAAREVTDFDPDLEDADHEQPADLCGSFGGDNIDPQDDAEGGLAYNNMAQTYNWWRGAMGRDAYNGSGDQVEFDVHVSFPVSNNASYSKSCDLFFFGDGTPTLDIVGHEFTHGVNHFTNGLIYAYESGALDESLADIFGYMVDQTNWLNGEGSSLAGPPVPGVLGCSSQSALRDISNPPCFGQPDHMLAALSGDGQGLRTLPAGAVPDAVANDYGGVHTNSGIHNKVASLIIAGGQFNGRNLGTGLGWAKSAWLFYDTLATYLNSASPFADARNAAVYDAQVRSDKGEAGFSPTSKAKDVCLVRNAYAAVGIGNGDLDCDGIEDNVDPDTDGDGVPNSKDNCPQVMNSFQADADGDGMGNNCDTDDDNDGLADTSDNCPLVANPGQEDFNGNGVGDVCDDSDFDLSYDATDNCPEVANYDQSDIDADGIGDVCDDDLDGDGVGNSTDNCPDISNSVQQDGDTDGIGDACDKCKDVQSSDNGDPDKDGLGNPCDSDDDNDGVLDGADNCPQVANKDQIDIDGNGQGLPCDDAESANFRGMLDAIGHKFVPDEPLGLPVHGPECPACGAYLPNGYEINIAVDVATDYAARVVDSQGEIVAKLQPRGAGSGVLKFQPAPYAKEVVAGGGGLAGRGFAAGAAPLGAAGAMLPSDIAYRLEIIPAPSTDFRRAYAVRLAIGAQVKPPCGGDCNDDGEVTIEELLQEVNVALGIASALRCPPGDTNADGEITIDEILSAVNLALRGCGVG